MISECSYAAFFLSYMYVELATLAVTDDNCLKTCWNYSPLLSFFEEKNNK